ncbi:MAG: hypothetical protein VKJ02_18185 [Snowella sp.]|nr:hypothetical protein [Snowella sp.]
MNSAELRGQIQDYVEQLSNDKLLIAADFLAHLAGQNDNDPTEELLKISGFQESFEKAKKNVNEGKVIILESDEVEFDPDDTPVEEVKASLRRALQEYKEGKRIPLEDMWKGIDAE